MIASTQIRAALEGMSAQDRQLVDPARWARDADEIDEEILSVFAAPAFLELRLSEPGGVVNLLDDFDILAKAAQQGEEFRLVANAFRLSADILARDPGQLATQLLARLPARGQGPLADLQTNLATEYGETFRPVRTTLTPATQAFRVRQISDAGLTAIACAADGKLAALDAHGRVHFVVLLENRLDVVATLRCAKASTLAFTPAGDRLLVGAQDGMLTVIDARSRTKAAERQLQREIRSFVCLDEERLVIEHQEGASVVSWADGRELARVGSEEGVDCFTAIAAAPGGDLVYTGGFEGRVDSWRADDGSFVGRVGWFGEFAEGWTSRAIAMMEALTRSKSFIARGDTVERLDFEAMLDQMPHIAPEHRAAMQRRLRDDSHRRAVTAILPAGDGRTVIAGSISGELRAWNTSAGAQSGSLEGHGRGIKSVALNPDGDRLISTGDGTVRVWSISRMVPLGELPTRAGTPEAVCCLPDRRTVVAACGDGTLNIWDLASPLKPSAPVAKPDPLIELGCPPDQSRAWAITRSGSIFELSADTGSLVRAIQLPIGAGVQARLSPGGRRLAVAVAAGLYVFDVATSLPMYYVPFSSSSESKDIQELAVSDDGERVVISRVAELMAAVVAHDGQLEMVEMASGERVTLKTDTGLIGRLEISADGRFVLFGSKGPGLEVWDLNLRRKIVEQTIQGPRASGFTFHPDGRSVLWCEERLLRRLHIGAEQPPEAVLTTPASWRRLTVSPGGRYAALIGETRLDLWDFDARIRLAGFEADQELTSCRVMPETQTVMMLDKSGGVTVLRFPFLHDEPAQTAAALREGLASTIDSIAALERTDRSFEAAGLWLRLAQTPSHSAVFRVGLARLLHQTGRPIVAETILCRVIEETKGEERRLAFDLLLHLGTADGISAMLRSGLRAAAGDREAVVQLTAAAEWLVGRKERGRLQSIADAAATEISRLVAAQALADIDEVAAAQALHRLFDDRSIDAELRVVAWISMRSLMPTRDWLEQTCRNFANEPWPEKLLERIGHEVLRALKLGVALQDLLSPAADDLRALAPLRTVVEWNQEAIGLGTKRRYDEAIAAVGRAIRRRPLAARYYHTRGSLRLGAARERRDQRQFSGHSDPAQKLFELAVDDLTKTIGLDPSHEGAWSQRGYALLELGRYELALPDIVEAIRLDGSDPTDFRNRAYCLEQLGRHEEAEQEQRRAEVLENKGPGSAQGESQPTILGRTRAGDEPTSAPADIALLDAQGRLALERLGLIAKMRTELAALVRSEITPSPLVSETLRVLALLDGRRDIEAIAADTTATVTSRVAALKRLMSPGADDATLDKLTEIAIDPSHPPEVRVDAACTVAEHGPVEITVALLRRLRDVDQTRNPPPIGTLIAPHVFRALHGRPGAHEQIAGLARDAGVAPVMREIAGEVVGTYIDPAEGSGLLRGLAAELEASDPLHKFIDRAVAAFDGKDAKEPATAPNLAQDAFDAFCVARSAEEIAPLAREHSPFRDPEFVARAASFLPRVPPAERELYEAKLERLRSLPPDHELVGFRMFARANSPEEMRAAVLRYPFLALPDYYPNLAKIIELTADADTRPAFERRLAWLRAIPPDPWQEALQAFANAETVEKLKDAIACHPMLGRRAFPLVAEKALGDSVEWPALVRRLETLSTLVAADADELVKTASRAIAAGEPEHALQLLDPLDGQADEQVRWLRALALVTTGREEEAIELLNDFISRAPDALSYAARGRAFCNLRRFREARADFTEALALAPDNFEARLGRGVANASLDLREEAIDDLNRAEALNPTEALIYPLRGAQLMAEGRAEEALQDFRKAVELFPEETSMRVTLAKLLADLGWQDEMREILGDPHVLASGEDAADIELPGPVGLGGTSVPSQGEPERAFQALMAANSTDELEEAVKRVPLLADARFIEYLESHCAGGLEGDFARAFEERLNALRRIVINPAQLAFDALMNTRSEHELRLALDRHELLGDAAFLEHLSEIARQIEPAAASEHLTSSVATLKRLIEPSGSD
jgi:tetratricopeptide (TPR) repeat protein/WD40 repeat protein